MKIAIFNGFNFHYEMYGYIIHLCKCGNYDLTIYDNNNQEIIDIYNKIFINYTITYKHLLFFKDDKNLYDAIILTTDDDHYYDKTDININKKTIIIEHFYMVRAPMFNKKIATRPFSNIHYRDWALPVYPILNIKQKKDLINSQILPNNLHIVILGDSVLNYNTNILNRLKINYSTTIIHAISRAMSIDKFNGINENIKLIIHANISNNELYNILYKANYIITDINESENYTDNKMSGAIPLSFSTLTPLIISKQSNKYYKFVNVIEYDKESNDEILLYNIDMNKLYKERENMIKKNNCLFIKYLKYIKFNLN